MQGFTLSGENDHENKLNELGAVMFNIDGELFRNVFDLLIKPIHRIFENIDPIFPVAICVVIIIIYFRIKR